MSTVLEPSVETVATEIAEGWHHGMTMLDYLAIEAMSASGIEGMRVSPGFFLHRSRNPSEETASTSLGSALHMALLEPDLFDDTYVVLGQCEATVAKTGERCTNPGNRYRDGQAFCGVKGHDPSPGSPAEPEGKKIVGQAALDQIDGMAAAILRHPEARQFFRGKGRSEVVGIWRDPATGVLCKLRLDRTIDRAEFIHMDVKTTVSAAPVDFRRTIGKFGYHRKAAWYRRGLAALERPCTASALAAVETVPRMDYGRGPEHGVMMYLLDEGQIAKVGAEIDRHLWTYAECLRTGVWPGYPTGFQPIEVAPWDMPAEQPTANRDQDFDEDEEV